MLCSMLLFTGSVAIIYHLTFVAYIEIAALLTTTSTHINFGARDVQFFHIIIDARDVLLLLITRIAFLIDGSSTHCLYTAHSITAPATRKNTRWCM